MNHLHYDILLHSDLYDMLRGQTLSHKELIAPKCR